MIKDAIGNELSDQDTVVFSLGLGQSVTGQVKQISRIVGAEQGQQTIHVLFTLPLPVLPNGVVPGIVKAVLPNDLR